MSSLWEVETGYILSKKGHLSSLIRFAPYTNHYNY